MENFKRQIWLVAKFFELKFLFFRAFNREGEDQKLIEFTWIEGNINIEKYIFIIPLTIIIKGIIAHLVLKLQIESMWTVSATYVN